VHQFQGSVCLYDEQIASGRATIFKSASRCLFAGQVRRFLLSVFALIPRRTTVLRKWRRCPIVKLWSILEHACRAGNLSRLFDSCRRRGLIYLSFPAFFSTFPAERRARFHSFYFPLPRSSTLLSCSPEFLYVTLADVERCSSVLFLRDNFVSLLQIYQLSRHFLWQPHADTQFLPSAQWCLIVLFFGLIQPKYGAHVRRQAAWSSRPSIS